MKRVIILLFLVILINGCSTKETPAPITGDIVANVPAPEPVVKTPKEDVKTYEFSVEGTEVYVNEMCSITSRIKNLDSVKHRYRLNSYVIINNIKEGIGEEFNLEPGEIKMVARDIKCPEGTEDTVSSEGFEVR